MVGGGTLTSFVPAHAESLTTVNWCQAQQLHLYRYTPSCRGHGLLEHSLHPEVIDFCSWVSWDLVDGVRKLANHGRQESSNLNATGTGQTLLIIERESIGGGENSPWAWREDWVGGYNMLDRSCRQIFGRASWGPWGQCILVTCCFLPLPFNWQAVMAGWAGRSATSLILLHGLYVGERAVPQSVSQSSGCIFHSLGYILGGGYEIQGVFATSRSKLLDRRDAEPFSVGRL